VAFVPPYFFTHHRWIDTEPVRCPTRVSAYHHSFHKPLFYFRRYENSRRKEFRLTSLSYIDTETETAYPRPFHSLRMYSITTSVLSFLFVSTLGLAAPTPLARPESVEPPNLYRRQETPTLVPQADVDSFNPSTHFSAVAYCDLGLTETWTCGEHCDATPGFETSLVGGDGGDTPQCELSTSMSCSVPPYIQRARCHHIRTIIILTPHWPL